jgi:hypothetical protein
MGSEENRARKGHQDQVVLKEQREPPVMLDRQGKMGTM